MQAEEQRQTRDRGMHRHGERQRDAGGWQGDLRQAESETEAGRIRETEASRLDVGKGRGMQQERQGEGDEGRYRKR